MHTEILVILPYINSRRGFVEWFFHKNSSPKILKNISYIIHGFQTTSLQVVFQLFFYNFFPKTCGLNTKGKMEYIFFQGAIYILIFLQWCNYAFNQCPTSVVTGYTHFCTITRGTQATIILKFITMPGFICSH